MNRKPIWKLHIYSTQGSSCEVFFEEKPTFEDLNAWVYSSAPEFVVLAYKDCKEELIKDEYAVVSYLMADKVVFILSEVSLFTFGQIDGLKK